MADALAAVGLASSIITFFDLAQKIVSRLNEFSNDFKDSTNALIQIQMQLPLIVDGLRRIRDRAESDKLNDEAKAALKPVVLECHKQTQRLSGILDSTLPASDASKWERRKKAIISLTTDRKVKEISDALNQYLQTLTFYHSIEEGRPNPIAKKAFWLVPFDRNPEFVGRDTVFDEIDQNFQVPEGTQPKVALYGLGGIGKSQIALEYCFRRRNQQPTCSVFWVNAATVARFEESFQRMANGFDLNSREDTQNDSLVLVKMWLETELLDPWIMVIDNVDDEVSFFREKCRNGKIPSQVLPRCSHGWLLFTSRTRDVAVDLASPGIPICVDFLTKEEGLKLLRNRLGPDPSEAQLVDLLSELDHIPLAVTQAISFILKRRKSVEQYLGLYRMDDNSKSRLLSHKFLDHGRQVQTLESVARTWQISFEWIQRHHAKAAEILCLMGFYQHHGVPEQLLRCDNIDAFEFEDSIAVLQAFSLLDMSKSRGSYSTHRLIQVAMKLWLEQNGPAQLEKWALRALELITLRFPPPYGAPPDDYWDDCQSLLPHAEILLQRSFKIAKRESDLEKAKLLLHTGGYTCWARDNVKDVQRRFKRSFEIRESHLGPKHPHTLESMCFYFWSLVGLEQVNPSDFDNQEAAAVGYALLELQQEVLGPRHPDTIGSMRDLASFLSKEGESEKSENLQREALKLSEEVNGSLNIATVYCMERLADVLHNMERFDEAVELATTAVTASTSLLGMENRTVLVAKSNLALYLAGAGKVEEAIEMNRDVMKLEEKILGSEHPDTLVTAMNLALSLAADERYKEALDVLDCALSTIERSRRVYRPPTSAQDFIGLKLEYENELAAKQLKESNIAPNPSEGSGVADG